MNIGLLILTIVIISHIIFCIFLLYKVVEETFDNQKSDFSKASDEFKHIYNKYKEKKIFHDNTKIINIKTGEIEDKDHKYYSQKIIDVKATIED